MENIIKYFQLYFTKGLGNRSLKAVIEHFGSIDNVFNSSFEEVSKVVGEKTAKLILEKSFNYRKEAEAELKKVEKHHINLLLYESDEYPQNLKNIPDPPLLLYIKGAIPDNYGVSIVGTRKPSNYGRKIAYLISKRICENGICVISGGAYGIDTIAHKSALENNGKTIAVLGTGINISYPATNKRLFEKIAENGALISEFPIDTKPSKFNFPLRNRIVAGLSEATVVVEAPEKSGSLITAKLANEYGKPVFAVPSNIDNLNGKGCNLLIKEGAIPLIDFEIIFNEIPYLSKYKINTNLIELSEEETLFLQTIEGEAYLDEIVEKLDLSFEQAFNLIFNLEMKGIIKNENGLIKRLVY